MPIVRCRVSGLDFEVTDTDIAEYERLSPKIAGSKVLLPPPTISPDERQRRRLAFRNERFLYADTCAVSGKPMISCYSPDKSLQVCERSHWLEQDNCQFGREFDFSRPFFEQFAELFGVTYKANVTHDGEMVNSTYTHFCGWLKNGYLAFDIGMSEDIMYSVWLAWSKNCIDCLYSSRCELCYECVKAENCYNVLYSSVVTNCSFSAFLYNCIGCQHCIGCSNLRNKQYYVFNQPVSKEEYQRIWSELFSGSYDAISNMANRFEQILEQTPRKATNNINVFDSRGDYLTNCQNVFDSYNCGDAKDCKFIYDAHFLNDCYDVGTFGQGMEFCYEMTGSGGEKEKTGISSCYFCAYAFYGGHNLFYSINCHNNSKDLFGCCDLRAKQYCILNQQYTRDEYFQLLPKVVEHLQNTGEWGEFFPMTLSPFGYNESLAQEDYPLSKEQAVGMGANWSDFESPAPQVKRTISEKEMNDRLSDEDSAVLEQAIVCKETAKPFRIVSSELSFYRDHGLPLPRVHPEERHRKRKRTLNPRRLYQRVCSTNQSQILTSYPPEFEGVVSSNEAFNQALSGVAIADDDES